MGIEQYMAKKRVIPIYMIVTQDKYELPLFVAESLAEMSEMTGIREDTLRKGFSRIRKKRDSKYRIAWVRKGKRWPQ